MQLFWLIVSFFCLFIAGFFFYHRNFDVTFIVATLGIVAWFLRVRTRFKAAADAREKEAESVEEDIGEDES